MVEAFFSIFFVAPFLSVLAIVLGGFLLYAIMMGISHILIGAGKITGAGIGFLIRKTPLDVLLLIVGIGGFLLWVSI